MRLSDFYPPRFLRGTDLDGKPFLATITKVIPEKVFRQQLRKRRR